MSPERQRAAASAGGKAVHAKGTGHKWTSEEAKAAGRKGGRASRRRRSIHDGITSHDGCNCEPCCNARAGATL